MSLFSLRNVSFRYPSQKEDALHDITCDIEKGELIALLGGDGAGKSTFARLLNGIIPHTINGTLSGKIYFKGIQIKDFYISELIGQIGLALQDPDIQLFMDSIEEELAFGPENLALPPDEIESRIAKALALMEITDLRSKSPKAISGGQKQRLIIASILTMGTETIILDEPFSMLDPAVKKALLDTLKKMCVDRNMTVIVTSQDAEDLYRYSDKVIILNKGRLEAIGKPSEVLSSSDLLTSLGIEPPQLFRVRDRLKSIRETESSNLISRYISSHMFGSQEVRKS